MSDPVQLSDGWLKVFDAGSGKHYFANPGTGATSWELPPGVVDPSIAALPEGWVEAADPTSGRSYYVHLPTQTTTWERPTAEPGAAPAPAPAAAPEPAAQAQPVAASPAPAPAAATSAAVVSGAGAVASAKKTLPAPIKAQWKKILDFARTEASSKIANKNKKFFGLRKFADVAARRKKEALLKKATEAEEEAAAAKEEATVKVSKPIIAFLDVELPKINKMNIEEFAESSFELNRKGIFGAKTTVPKILSWKNDIIKKALLKLPTKELEATAIQSFRNVTGFMGDRSSGKEDAGHAEKLLKTCLHASGELRDEVFCQIIKQTTNNPSAESTLKGWQLLGVVAGAFAPGKEFEPYLLSYCDSHKDDGGGIGDYAKYAIGRIVKTSTLGPRREVPTAIEIEACKTRLPVLVRVYHLDGSFDILPVTSWVTPHVLKQMVCAKRGILDGEAFSIYEMTPEGEERFLDPDERILDLVAYWQRLFEEEKGKADDAAGKKKKKRATGNDFYRVVFKVHMYFEPSIQDKAAQHEMFVQASYDVVSARYPCGEKDCLALAALQLQAEFGDEGLADLSKNLVRYLPAKYAESTRTSELASEIKKQHTAHAGKTALKCETEYLAYVKDWQVYGSSFFFVEPQMNVELPDEVFLAVNPKGILIINPDTKEVLATHPYSEVPTWGHSGSSFVLHIGNLIKQSKLYFATEQGKEVNDLVRAYVNHLCVAP